MLLLGTALVLFAVACKSSSPSSNSNNNNSPMNMAGNWTITGTSSQGSGSTSGTVDVEQSGQGIGINGATTLTTLFGSITVQQSGTSLTGTFTNATKGVTYNFTGTLSGGNITIAGAAVPCAAGTQFVSMTGTVATTKMHGNYIMTADPGCYNPSDSGAWSAIKQ